MNLSSPNISIPVDVSNPGQFFACCGLLELAHRLWPGAEGHFSKKERIKERKFVIASKDHAVSLKYLLDEFINCPLGGLTTEERDERKKLEKEKKRQQLNPEKEIRRKELGKKAREGSINIGLPFSLELNWWMTDGDTVVKTWAGQQEIHKISRAAQEEIKKIKNIEDMFDFSSILSSPPEYGKSNKNVEPFYFDSRRFSHALDTGFSLDVQKFKTYAHPAVELFCLIGLQRFRPKIATKKWYFEYVSWYQPLPPIVACSIANGAIKIDNGSTYQFRLNFRDDQKRYRAFSFAIPK